MTTSSDIEVLRIYAGEPVRVNLSFRELTEAFQRLILKGLLSYKDEYIVTPKGLTVLELWHNDHT